MTSVVLLVATACTLVGVCALMLTVTAERAFHEEINRSEPPDVSVTAYLVELRSSDIATAQAEAQRVVEDVLGGMRPTVETTATSRLRELAGDASRAYLMSTDQLEARADLASGRWPVAVTAGPAEAVVPGPTARLLDLSLGDEVVLGGEAGLDGAEESVTVTVVGTFRPRAAADWESDPLSGAGFSPAYSDGLPAAPTYGPFVVPEASFLASGSSVKGVRVTAHPSLELARQPSLRAAVRELDHAAGLLVSEVGDRARITRVASELPRTLTRIDAQQASTRSTVLVVLLLGTALSLAAALLAGWLVGAVRDGERHVLVAMGLGRRQELGTAALEALLLSLVASVLAVPAAAVIHSRLTHLAGVEAAGLRQGPTTTAGLVLAVVATALLLTVALVATTAAAGPATAPSPRSRAVIRLGLAPVLAASAAFAWWQLRTQPSTAAEPDDVALTLAPVVFLAVLTVLGVRLVPVLLARAARAGIRSRSLVLPLVAQQAARRPHTSTAMVLVAAAVAAAVFGLALRTTWERSQQDQAALRVGTDLSLTLSAPAGLEEATQVATALEGHDRAGVSAVIHRPLALGRYVGEEGARPVLVAFDTRQADALLRGRRDPGRDWGDVFGGLAPDQPVAGVPLPDDGTGIRLRGRSPDGSALTVTPTAVLEDGAGFRSSLSAGSVALDGTSHPLEWLGPLGSGQRLVGLRLELDGSAGRRPSLEAEVRATVSVPSTVAEPAAGAAWQLVPLRRDSPVAGPEVSVVPTADGTDLRATFDLDLLSFEYTGADVLATAFPVRPDVPVVASQDLVDAVDARIGDELSAIVGDTVLALRVSAVVPSVPSAPGEAAVLADADALSRALIDAGSLDPVVDGWWVARPAAATIEALQDLGLGDVTTREQVAEQLARGPLRVTVPTTLLMLVVLAVAMFLAAVALVLTAGWHRRSAEVVRLRALGLSRRDARRLLLAEHLAFFVPLVLVGTLVGLASALALGPHLIRSDLGAAPLPRAVVVWPWRAELWLVGGMLLGAAVMSAVVASLHVRSSGPGHPPAGGER